MADATTALGGASETMFHNPAIMALMDRAFDVSLVRLRYNWVNDIFFHQGSIALSPMRGKYGTMGLTFLREDYGESTLIAPAENDSGYVITDTFRLYSQAIGLGYAYSPIPSLSIGGHVRHITDHFHPDENDIITFDLGLIYQTGFRGLLVGLSWRNYPGRSDGLMRTPTLEIGASVDLFDLARINTDSHSLVVALDRMYPYQYEKRLQVGVEYTFMKIIVVRTGYRRPTDEPERNLGIGLRVPIGGMSLRLDYAYQDLGLFKDIHQFAIQLLY